PLLPHPHPLHQSRPAPETLRLFPLTCISILLFSFSPLLFLLFCFSHVFQDSLSQYKVPRCGQLDIFITSHAHFHPAVSILFHNHSIIRHRFLPAFQHFPVGLPNLRQAETLRCLHLPHHAPVRCRYRVLFL